MKKLKLKQLGYFCQYCPPKTTRATYRSNYGFEYFSCNEHKGLLPSVVIDEDYFYEQSSWYLK